MEQLQQLINRLVQLESEFDSLPDLNKIIKDLEALKQSKNENDIKFIRDELRLFAEEFFNSKNSEILNKIVEDIKAQIDVLDNDSNDIKTKLENDVNSLVSDLSSKFETFKKALAKQSNDYQLELDDKVTNAIALINAKLKTVKNGLDGKDGLNGRDGLQGLKGDNGLNGNDGIGISNITYKSNTLIITLSNGSEKKFKLNIPSYGGGGGGVSQDTVSQMISDAIQTSSDVYTKSEVDNIVSSAIDDLVNGANENLNTLQELSNALNNDENFATNVLNQISLKADSSNIYTKAESDAMYERLDNQNLYIQSTQPTLATGKTALWIDTSNDDIMFNIVIGD